MRKEQFINNHMYHVFNRGVDKREIFLAEEDYYRFIRSLFEFNDESPAFNSSYYFDPKTMNVDVRHTKYVKSREPRDRIVDLLIFTLMPNHYHLLLRQKTEGGITKFMRKLGTGYTNYFNKKYERTGVLFQGKFKAVKLESQEHFHYLPYYIHSNPLRLLKYRSPTSINWRKGLQHLETYRWSSFPDYVGKTNFPSVTHRTFLLRMFGGEKEYKKHTVDYLRGSSQLDNAEEMQDLLID